MLSATCSLPGFPTSWVPHEAMGYALWRTRRSRTAHSRYRAGAAIEPSQADEYMTLDYTSHGPLALAAMSLTCGVTGLPTSKLRRHPGPMSNELIIATIGAAGAVFAAVFAGAAALRAGQLQGRSAYRGPVDAVRRQHQRAAYADLLGVARELQRAGGTLLFFFTSPDPPGDHPLLGALVNPVIEKSTELSPLLDMVHLEGPDYVAHAAQKIKDEADSLTETAVRTNYLLSTGESAMNPEHYTVVARERQQLLIPGVASLAGANKNFTEAARAHLNGTT